MVVPPGVVRVNDTQRFLLIDSNYHYYIMYIRRKKPGRIEKTTGIKHRLF